MGSLRVTVVGVGAIGASVARALASGGVPGAVLSGVVVRRPETATANGFTPLSIDDALAASDLIVECAGVDAVAEFGPRVVAAGRDFLVTSVGALVDTELRTRLFENGPGRTFVTTG